MTWTRSTTTYLPVTPEAAWSVLSDLTRWPQWEPTIASVRLDGPLTKGVTGAYLPAKRWVRAVHERSAPPLRVTGHDDGRRLEITQPTPVAACGSSGPWHPRARARA